MGFSLIPCIILKHIELFAGCGGMTLGLERAGFDLFFANELSPMAGETFAYNLLGEDLAERAIEKQVPTHVIWLKSKYARSQLSLRLRENPFDVNTGAFSDISSNTNLKGKLIIGSINHLLSVIDKSKKLRAEIENANIDLISGGPPCQGFSLAGKRIKDDYKNLLPLSFARLAGIVKPKVIILENVKGITAPFTTEDGLRHHAHLEVAKAFSLEGFVPVCMLLNSKYFGVPQNRPRFILYAFRKDVFDQLKNKKDNSDQTNSILLNSLLFFNKVHLKKDNLQEIKLIDIRVYDIDSDPLFFDGRLLPQIRTIESEFVTAAEAIKDISSITKEYILSEFKSNYSLTLSKLFKSNFHSSNKLLQNHDGRKHSFNVKARFRLYQILNNVNGVRQDAIDIISGKSESETTFSKVFKAFAGEDLLISPKPGEGHFGKIDRFADFKEYLKKIESRKHSQRALRKDEPAPAQMTIPDDLCHYSPNQLRTLTVREMARFQSFPDWFVFKSKITTGGEQRSYEVPQYTQVGNAVPPLLAYELGLTIRRLLNSIR
jgi:DNA (cytosine-5)-methyltransferase 1